MKRTIETAKKYLAMEAPNGYKFNVSRYLKNPARSCEYPAFIKQIKEDEKYIYAVCTVYCGLLQPLKEAS